MIATYPIFRSPLSTWQKKDKSVTIPKSKEAIKHLFPMVLFIIQYKVVLIFVSVDEILKCDHSNESYRAVLSNGDVYYAVQGGSNF